MTFDPDDWMCIVCINPIDERVTQDNSGDGAGGLDDYDFTWYRHYGTGVGD